MDLYSKPVLELPRRPEAPGGVLISYERLDRKRLRSLQ
jgi:hypothetical protein